jgi:predicted metal-dependent phosphotriesterase family hydrolase
MFDRRKFVKNAAVLGIGSPIFLDGLFAAPGKEIVMTVNGPIMPSDMQFTLTHEHILVDFIGADKIMSGRYKADEVFTTALPYLLEAKQKGCATFIDCTPAWLGRDATLLKRLADTAGLHIITNTGYYGAAKEKYLPKHVYTETAEQLAKRWIAEWSDGIDGTGIKPGFIKTGVDEAPLTTMQRKVIEAAAIAHLATGLTIAIHTGDGKANKEQLEILHAHGVSPAARIWVHAQNEKDKTFHVAAAKIKSWVSFDGVNEASVNETIDYLRHMKSYNLLNRVLVSQDSGWYNVGEPGGGKFNHYNSIHDLLIPALKKHGFTNKEVDTIFIKNPAEAFAVGVRFL